jgi:mono/diheme cytochrome c family protein
LTWALDNWMHTSEVDTILRFKNGKFEVRKTLARGQWGAGMDDAGGVSRHTNQAALFVAVVPPRCYARYRNMLGTRCSYGTLDRGAPNPVWPMHPTPGVNRGYQDGILRPDGTLAAFTSVSAPTVYRGDRLPKDLYGNVFVVEPAANLVSRIIVNDDGTMLRGRKAYERGEFIASSDERFRPVYLSSAPDGTLYVVDMYHGIIQHKGFITEYLRDQILSRKLDRPQGYGRIYRVVHDTTKRDNKPALSKATSAQLVELLSHPNGWYRDTAQRILVERGDKTVVKALTDKAERASDWRTRLHALWILDGIDAITPATVLKAMDDSSRDVRVSALRLAERWSAEANSPVQAALLKKVGDKDWAVRRQLAATLGTLPDTATAKYTTLAGMLQQFGDDPMVVDAALTGLNGSEQKVLEQLFAVPAATPQVTAAITTLAATIVKSGQDARLQDVFKWTADPARPEWQRAALLDGAEAALLNRPLGGGRRGAPPANAGANVPANARGQRGGPGGAPAFARAETGGGGRGRGNVAPVRLGSEPAALKQLAASGGETGKRAEALLARLTWPGKPAAAGAAPPAAPLTAAEQKRFDEGKTVYTSLCVACHNENGEGREKMAPPLAGSNFATAAAHVPARILINGKEGSIGLMPPLGTTLTDDQIASVLTYVRRAWGNQASAVDAATVTEVRKSAADRNRPWTEAELTGLLEKLK